MNLTLYGEIVVLKLRVMNYLKRKLFFYKTFLKVLYMERQIIKRFGKEKVDRAFRLYMHMLASPERRHRNRMALLQHTQELADNAKITFSEAQELMEKCGVKF